MAIVVVLILILILYALYTLFSELVFHIWHIGTFFHGSRDVRSLALTFDDGPDETYTQQVLDILKQHGVRATFFLVAERAEAHPHLVQAIVAGGHEIASHSYYHRHAWLRTPWGTWLDIKRAKSTLERLSGQPVRFHRPPWGAFNPFTRLACKAFGLTPVLWDGRAVDWLPGDYADDVVRRVVWPAKPGSIVLCHDAGGAPGAPRNTIAALPRIITQLKELRFSFATVGQFADELAEKQARPSIYAGYPGWRRALIGIWSIVEVVFSRIYHVVPVNAIFRVNKTRWHHGVRLNDAGDQVMTDGMKVLDIHFQNDTLLTFSGAGDNKSLVKGLRMAKQGFVDIAHMLQYHPEYQDVRGLAAVTLMNRGIEMLGFHVEELPESGEKRRLQSYMQFLMGMYHPDGFRRLRQGTQSLSLKLVWMTKEEVIERYAPELRREASV